MSSHRLVIRNGTVIDGSGAPGFRADIGIDDGRIVVIGRIRDHGEVEIDAEGHVVTPGFVDGHTHMDAQLFWDPLGTSSCWHGVTSVVMGNCGFTLAPSKGDARELVVRNLERAEDIPAAALAEGVTWGFETFRQYLDAIDRLPKGINYGAYVGHSALRTWAMGDRAFDEPGTDDDTSAMELELRDALAAGAVGFTTSRSDNHVTSDDRPVASRAAPWHEVERLVHAVASTGGVFELANESVLSSPDPEARSEYTARLQALAVASGVPITFGITSFGHASRWQELLALLDATAAAGGRMFGQTSCRESAVMLSFQTRLPFDDLPEWQEVRRQPLREQAALLRDPSVRQRLVAAAHANSYALGPQAPRALDFDRIRVVEQTVTPNPTLGEMARDRGTDPVELMIDLAVSSGFDQFFAQVSGNADPDEVVTILRHPRNVMTFSDSGAHVSQLINSSLPTHLLAYWVRERQSFTVEDAVRMLTLQPATAWSLADRGLVREGFIADLNVFDPATVRPELPVVAADLPGGAKRLTQRARGFLATTVAGEVVLRDGEHTGALPGRVLRRRRGGTR
jgi:N-acyl-D-amino-acid deacylase